MIRIARTAAVLGALALVLPAAVAAPSSAQDRRGRDGLGRVWDESESGWSGHWVRRGRSDMFDAEWTHPNGQRESATLRITVVGRLVTVERRGDRAGICMYHGTLDGGGRSVRGVYACDWGSGTTPWSASIR